MFGLFTESGILVFFLCFIFLCPTKMEAGSAQDKHSKQKIRKLSEIPSNLIKPWDRCMHIVCNNGEIADLEILLDQHPPLAHLKDVRGRSLLIEAIFRGNEKAVLELTKRMDLEQLNAQNFNGNPVLFVAIEKENKYIIASLLTSLFVHGANINNVRDREGFNVFHFSCTRKTPEMLYFVESVLDELRKKYSEQIAKNHTIKKELNLTKTIYN